jgi:FkbM family methyltransferase
MLYIVKFYSSLHEFFHKVFKINIPGLGFLYRKINYDFYLDVKGKKLFFNHKAADNYGRLINGRFNEPETHIFLDYVFNNSKRKDFHFVDVGGNIGEFVLDYSSNSNVKKVTVFEPQPEQSKAIQCTIEKNSFNHVELVRKPASNKEEPILFNFNKKNATASGISNDPAIGTEIIATTLDKSIKPGESDFVLLIDVEGAELRVLEGAKSLLDSKMPLIIFEYNHVTRMSFSLEDVQKQLGSDYTIYRLRTDGYLDQDFSRTWNLVALPKNDVFQHVNSLIVN